MERTSFFGYSTGWTFPIALVMPCITWQNQFGESRRDQRGPGRDRGALSGAHPRLGSQHRRASKGCFVFSHACDHLPPAKPCSELQYCGLFLLHDSLRALLLFPIKWWVFPVPLISMCCGRQGNKQDSQGELPKETPQHQQVLAASPWDSPSSSVGGFCI